jgi:protein SFI1
LYRYTSALPPSAWKSTSITPFGAQLSAGGAGAGAGAAAAAGAPFTTPSTAGAPVKSASWSPASTVTPWSGKARGGRESSTAAHVPACGVLGLSSVFTAKFLQAKRRKPHKVQFFSGACGVFEQWELVGGVKTRKSGKRRGWGALASEGDVEGGEEPSLPRAMASLFGEDNSARLGGRDFCVVRSKQTPDCVILVVRLRAQSGNAVTSASPPPPLSAHEVFKRWGSAR